MVVELNMRPLTKILDQLPLAALLDMVPEQAGPLKDVLGLLTGLSSRIVVSLANASATVDTVAPIAPPVADATEEPEAEAPSGDNADAAPPVDTAPPTTPESSESSAPPGDLDATPLGAGLPPLFSIPGILLYGGIALASVAGSYFRKVGAAALGAGAPCPHGLDSGLPDLRKA
jgi:hypothetical protein